MAAVVTALVLLMLLIAVGLAFYWQERHPSDDGVPVYGVEDSITYVSQRLSPGLRDRIGPADVRRILEWEVRYLQDPSMRRDPDAPPVAGGVEAATFAYEQSYAAGHAYDPDLILEVLALRGRYLAELGVVGNPVVVDDERDPG
jgi:hypothetical protein